MRACTWHARTREPLRFPQVRRYYPGTCLYTAHRSTRACWLTQVEALLALLLTSGPSPITDLYRAYAADAPRMCREQWLTLCAAEQPGTSAEEARRLFDDAIAEARGDATIDGAMAERATPTRRRQTYAGTASERGGGRRCGIQAQ